MAETNGVNQSSDVQPSGAPQPNTVSTAQAQLAPASMIPQTSLADTGLTRRPRDARIVHLVLAHLGVTAYQERVPLQLLDFAYRYTSSTLQDALHLSNADYVAPGKGAQTDGSSISLAALRLSIASRLNYQFSPSLPKEFLLDLAAERNRVALPTMGREWGVRLPPERYCLTGVGWGLKEDWESEGSEEGDAAIREHEMLDLEHGQEPRESEDAKMEDVFTGEDKDMATT
ncbi:MAG: Transcription initiation factor TFIID subunit 9 [Geoglossum umbratile]|nr:MAG: Transcription initiation factor TFIID subunit 9 [Geoglossum umbratile]